MFFRLLSRTATLAGLCLLTVSGAPPALADASATSTTTTSSVPSPSTTAPAPTTTTSTLPGGATTTTSGAPNPNVGTRRTQSAGAALQGAGASFPELEINQWVADTSVAPYNLTVNYQPNGSTNGRTGFQAPNSPQDFGVSDIQYQPGEPTARPFTYIPISAGGLGFMYNLKDGSGAQMTTLNLSPKSACEVFSGAADFWDAPDIAADNPGVTLPHRNIIVIVRADGSGTSFVFSEWCIAQAPAVWAAFAQNQRIGNVPTSNWPQQGVDGRPFVALPGSDQDSAAAASTADSITAVEAGFAFEKNFPVASVLNHNGKYAQPTEANVTAALDFASQLPDGTHKLNFDAAGDGIYNPSTYSYLIAPTDTSNGFSTAKGQALGTFIDYSVTTGQQKANALGYASLGCGLVVVALQNSTKIPGAPTPPSQPSCNPNGAGGGGGGGGGGSGGGGVGGGSGGGAGGGGGGSGGGTGSGNTTTAAASPAAIVSGVSTGRTTGAVRGSGSSAAVASGGVPLGFTGGAQKQVAAVGLLLVALGEWSRRRLTRRPVRRRAGSPRR